MSIDPEQTPYRTGFVTGRLLGQRRYDVLRAAHLDRYDSIAEWLGEPEAWRLLDAPASAPDVDDYHTGVLAGWQYALEIACACGQDVVECVHCDRLLRRDGEEEARCSECGRSWHTCCWSHDHGCDADPLVDEYVDARLEERLG